MMNEGRLFLQLAIIFKQQKLNKTNIMENKHVALFNDTNDLFAVVLYDDKFRERLVQAIEEENATDDDDIVDIQYNLSDLNGYITFSIEGDSSEYRVGVKQTWVY